MPKRQAKNAFFYYMLHYREEQKKKGINYANLQEVSVAAGLIWPDLPPDTKAKFEAMAKNPHHKSNNAPVKYTSNGIPLHVIEQQEQDKRDAEEAERQDIKNFVKLKSFDMSILKEDIYVMDVNSYCRIHDDYLMAESTVLRFTLEDGIKDSYYETICPGQIPSGYGSEARQACKDLGLELPEDDSPRTNYMQVLANLIDYLKQDARASAKTLPPIFTLPDKVKPVKNFIQQMCNRAAEDESLFRVYRLDLLFFTLINAIKTQSNEGFPKESLAMVQFKKDTFRFITGLACEKHDAGDKAMECTSSRVKRWAFTVLNHCCVLVGVDPVPGRHLPHTIDIERVLACRDQRRERAAARVAPPDYAAICVSACRSVCETLNNSTLSAASISGTTPKVESPLRLPKTDLSKSMRPPPAPGLTQADFPEISAGRGRGRSPGGSAGSLNK